MKSSKVDSLLGRISVIRKEQDTQERLRMLQELNSTLPKHMKLDMPTLITNAYVRTALDIIEERVLLTSTAA